MEKKLKFIIASCCQTKEADIGSGSGVNSTINWDSFTHLQIMMCIEKEFGVSLDTKTMASLVTYNDILKYLKSALKKHVK